MNKLMLTVIAIVLLVLISDFTSRFVQGEPQANNSFNSQTNNVQPLPLLSQNAKQQLTGLFSNFDQPEPATETEQGLSAAKQAAQTGELLSVFAGDLELKLKAVIYTTTPYALIEQTNINTQQTQLVKYLNPFHPATSAPEPAKPATKKYRTQRHKSQKASPEIVVTLPQQHPGQRLVSDFQIMILTVLEIIFIYLSDIVRQYKASLIILQYFLPVIV